MSGYAYEPVKAMQLGDGERLGQRRSACRAAAHAYQRRHGPVRMGYGYDPNANIALITDQPGDASTVYYGYDAADRLKTAILTSASPGNFSSLDKL